ncbi:hypothetical protein L228DRAFT_257563 [Xylona heveae TC161]|uniref:MIT domain-containing protein n=1 Tax=Xylona heveae (strain CBS 132557 / TC161) TaxID=1328760 RepID=A0A165JCW8_XYLHT|nr:hypothetical protein L228DRAFT_257563 [Xylona heveae TC161]KZF26067.1 hypothetical protein L228DRAFT_257563 [Xylona heveae TC161]
MLGSGFLSSNPQHPTRRSSLSPSNSSSSVVTIQRAPSFRLHSDGRNIGDHIHNPRASPPVSPRSNRRSSGSYIRSSSIGKINDGIRNLNRWSQSTASSGSPETGPHVQRSRRRSSFAGTDHFASLGEIAAAGHSQGQYGFGGALISPTLSSYSSAAPTSPPEFPGSPESRLPRLQTTWYSARNDADSSATSTYFPGSNISHQAQISAQPWQAHGQDFGMNYHDRSTPSISPAKSRNGDRPRAAKPPSQKLMLSKALQKANTAVLLDNAQNFEGAIDAYRDACALLGQVMLKSSGEEDRQKLEAIQETYHARIDELQSLDPYFQVAEGKELPARPPSDYYEDQVSPSAASADEEDQNEQILQTSRMMHLVDDPSLAVPDTRRSMSTIRSLHPGDSLLPAFEEVEQIVSSTQGGRLAERTRWSRSPLARRMENQPLNLAPPMEEGYMPRPLTPRRPYGDQQNPDFLHPDHLHPGSADSEAIRPGSSESVSWLNTVDEDGSSSPPSIHSKSSFEDLQHDRLRPTSTATAAEFDAALDAAVEAAYGDAYEAAPRPPTLSENLTSTARRNVELAKERVREAEREVAIQMARERERERLLQKALGSDVRDSVELEYRQDEAEEEERILEEMTRDFVMDDVEFGAQSKSALPRQSDSSGFSGRTWGSSTGSFPTTSVGSTSLSTVAEAPIPPSFHLPPLSPPPHPPPSGALPAPPVAPQNTSNHSTSLGPDGQSQRLSVTRAPGQSVRDRRLSGNNTKQLTIETASKPSTAFPSPTNVSPGFHDRTHALSIPKSASGIPDERDVSNSSALHLPLAPNGMRMSRQVSAPLLGSDTLASSSDRLAASPYDTTPKSDTEVQDILPPGNPPELPEKPPSYGNLKKNHSSSSLKNRSFSISSPEFSDTSPITPMSTSFPSISQHRKGLGAPLPALPTPTLASLSSYSQPWGGVYLFESDFHSTDTPGSPNELAKDPPAPLEPCPTAYLLRPFWLMRCLYQTIAHPRGGYLSNKLFVPRDIWNVRNVKIKNIEEKISNCDLLTAAMLKLAKVDTTDADALLDEMQALETVLDQTQANLTKKLGNDVGVSGTWAFFKDAPSTNNTDSTAGDNPSSSSSLLSHSSSKGAFGSNSSGTSGSGGKSYLSSWRKLSRKHPAAGFAHGLSSSSSSSSTLSRDVPKEALSMDTVPTTSSPSAHPFPPRNIKAFQPTGPNATYMSSLARLFDSVQILDDLARQIEDPGLKHSSPTHVGLELSTRHAAEFFAFYICRFVLIDIGMMLDKFIKRGSEWAFV